MSCAQEMCPYWSGDGCTCDLLDIDAAERKRAQDALGAQFGILPEEAE